jgi:hypothetical protein
MTCSAGCAPRRNIFLMLTTYYILERQSEHVR